MSPVKLFVMCMDGFTIVPIPYILAWGNDVPHSDDGGDGLHVLLVLPGSIISYDICLWTNTSMSSAEFFLSLTHYRIVTISSMKIQMVSWTPFLVTTRATLTVPASASKVRNLTITNTEPFILQCYCNSLLKIEGWFLGATVVGIFLAWSGVTYIYSSSNL